MADALPPPLPQTLLRGETGPHTTPTLSTAPHPHVSFTHSSPRAHAVAPSPPLRRHPWCCGMREEPRGAPSSAVCRACVEQFPNPPCKPTRHSRHHGDGGGFAGAAGPFPRTLPWNTIIMCAAGKASAPRSASTLLFTEPICAPPPTRLQPADLTLVLEKGLRGAVRRGGWRPVGTLTCVHAVTVCASRPYTHRSRGGPHDHRLL